MGEEFKGYQSQIIKNDRALALELMNLGFNLVSGGTDNHLLLIDLSDKGISGRKAEEFLGRAGIVVNKNAIPFDPRPPAITSGIRLGTPALTSRGMKEDQMLEIARMISDILGNRGGHEAILGVAQRVRELCSAFPVYESQ